MTLSLGALAANAHADATVEQIVTALSGVEQAPGAEQIRAWGPASVATLVTLAQDAERPEFVRARAAAAIRTFAPAPEARAALERLVNNAPHPLVLRAALDGLCIAWGDLAIAQRFLSALSSDHREAAAWAIARSGRVEARAILTTAKNSEHDPALRATLDSALRELERAIASGSANRTSAVNSATNAARSGAPVLLPPATSARRSRVRPRR